MYTRKVGRRSCWGWGCNRKKCFRVRMWGPCTERAADGRAVEIRGFVPFGRPGRRKFGRGPRGTGLAGLPPATSAPSRPGPENRSRRATWPLVRRLRLFHPRFWSPRQAPPGLGPELGLASGRRSAPGGDRLPALMPRSRLAAPPQTRSRSSPRRLPVTDRRSPLRGQADGGTLWADRKRPENRLRSRISA